MVPLYSYRPCAGPQCGALVVRGTARCAACRARAGVVDRARRGTATERGYDARWRAYRRTFLMMHPLCTMCGAKGLVAAATVVDHVRAHKGDTTLFWDTGNHRSLCKPCHDARTDEGDFGK